MQIGASRVKPSTMRGLADGLQVDEAELAIELS
jgi:hypothetical protein